MRLLRNPRIYIYSAAAIFAALFFQYQQKQATALRQHNRTMEVERVHQAPVAKEAFLTPTGEVSWKLYVFGNSEELPFVSSLREKFSGKCTVLHIQAPGEDVKSFFQLDALPAAILYNAENEVVGRFQGPFAEEVLIDAIRTKIE